MEIVIKTRQLGRPIVLVLLSCMFLWGWVDSAAMAMSSSRSGLPPGQHDDTKLLRAIIEAPEVLSWSLSPDDALAAAIIRTASIDQNNTFRSLTVFRTDDFQPIVANHLIGEDFVDEWTINPLELIWNESSTIVSYRGLRDDGVQVYGYNLVDRQEVKLTSSPADILTLLPADDSDMLRVATGPTRSEVRQWNDYLNRNGLHLDRSVPMATKVYIGLIRGRHQRFVYVDSGEYLSEGQTKSGVALHTISFTAESPNTLDTGQSTTWPGLATLLNEAAWRGADSDRHAYGDGQSEPSAVDLLCPVAGDVQTDDEAQCCTDQFCADWRVVFSGSHSESAREITIAVNSLGHSRIYLGRGAGGEIRLVAETTLALGAANGDIRLGRCGLIGPTSLLCSAESATRSSFFVEVDVTDGSVTEVLRLPGGINLSDQVAAFPIEWENALGLRGTGLVLASAEPGKSTKRAVVTNYRCGGFRDTGGQADNVSELLLATNDFVAICVHFYFGDKPNGVELSAEEALIPFRYLRSYVDILAALSAASGVAEFHSKGLGITGQSFGSQAAAFAVLKSLNIFAAAATRGGVIVEPEISVSFNPVWVGRENYLGNHSLDQGNDVSAKVFEHFSYRDNAQNIRTAYLWQPSDSAAPLGTIGFSRLADAGVPTELHLHLDAGHVLLRPAQEYSNQKRELDWLRFWLQPSRMSGSSIPDGDLQRWSDMKARVCNARKKSFNTICLDQ